MKRKNSIVFKLSALIIGIFTVLFVIFALMTSVTTHKETVKSAEEFAVTDTERVALRLSQQFRQVDESLTTTKNVLETLYAEKKLRAAEILTILEANLEGSPNAVGMSIIFEKDALTINPLSTEEQQLIDPQGRFAAYLQKTRNGYQLNPASDYDKPGLGDWYLVPKSEKKPVFQEPVTYNIDDKEGTMTMLSVPLLTKDGKFLGVLMASISLNFLTDLTEEITPAGGYATVISNDGTVIANSLKDAMNGTNMKDAIDWKPVKDAIDRGETTSVYVDSKSFNERAFNSFAPIQLDGFDETWTIQTVLPRSVIIEPFEKIAIITIFGGLVIMLLMGLSTAWFINRHIKPLTSVQKSMEHAAAGDLTEKVDTARLKQDEIGSVATSYNYMLDQTNQALAEVLEASSRLTDSSAIVNHAFEEIVASSQEVSAAIGEIALGASKQSEDTEETSEQIGRLADQITSISTLSDTMDHLSQQSVQSTQNGLEQVARLREQNEVANQMNEQVEQQIHALTDKIAGINQIITSIQDITAQTNLLALNASIEAARAGEHGKGFAVVAEEVRKLAEQSSNETSTIQKTVHEILEQSKATIEVVNENTKSMKDQNESVASTGQSFTRNAELTEEMNNIIAELSAKLAEMVANKDQAIFAIQSVSAISEETAASAEEVSASSVAQQDELQKVAESVHHLTRISLELKQIVERFKLAEGKE